MGDKWFGDFAGVYTGSPASDYAKPSATVVPAKKPTTTTAANPTSGKSYSDLVKEYSGRLIQFDQRCQSFPNNVTYKNGTSILLDNRSDLARDITIGGTKYSLAGYGYQVVTLSSSSLPKEMGVSCGSQGNVGKILLQALISQ